MSRSELHARVRALEADLARERAARRAAEAAAAEAAETAAELRREVAALQRLVHMSREARAAYAERQRRRAEHRGRRELRSAQPGRDVVGEAHDLVVAGVVGARRHRVRAGVVRGRRGRGGRARGRRPQL